MPRSRRYSDTYDSRRPRFVEDAPASRSSRRYDDAGYYYDDKYARSKSVSRYGDDRRRPRYDDDYYSRSGSSSSRRGRSNSEARWDDRDKEKLNQAVKAGLTAGAVEAWRQRKSRGDWIGERGARVATAAIGAAAVDALVDKDPTRKKKRHVGEAMIGGLVIDRLLNGPKRK